MSLTSRLDAAQQRHGWLGLPVAVVYKYVDDQGAYLAALITYYGFLSLFPLLLLGSAVLGFVLHGNPHLQQQVLSSALSQFPIVGQQIQSNLHGFHGSGAGLTIGIVGSLYGGLGVAQAGQNAMNAVWAVPRNLRPNPLRSRLRSLGLLGLLGGGVLATTVLSALTAGSSSFVSSLHLGAGSRILTVVVALLLNVGLFVAAFRLLTVHAVSTRDILLGAVVAAVMWEVLQLGGTYYLAHKVRGASEVYGTFGLVLGAMAWIYLEAFVVVLCAELNVVLRRRLWPRALLTPFTDDVTLTHADQRAYTSYAKAQRNKGFEQVDVSFDEPDQG